MAFVAPLIGAVVGGIAATAVGQAVIGTALALGAGYLSRKLAPKPREMGASSAGMRLSLRYDPNAEREIVFGQAATAGTLVYQHVYGPNGNDYVQMVYALADHPCDGLVGVYVNGTYRSIGSPVSTGWVNGAPVDGYGSHMWVSWHDGAWDQAADGDLIAFGGGAWTSAHRGRGVAYVRVTMLYDADVFADGLPRMVFLVRGARLYDPRKDGSVGGAGAQRWGQPETYAWSANPAVCLYNWRRGIFVGGERLAGMATHVAALPLDVWIAAMNVCDEAVARADGSGTDPRYRMHGVVGGDSNRDVIRAMLAAMAGEEIDTGGIIKLLPGAAQAPVMHITDDDLLPGGAVEIIPKLPRSQLINAVYGAFHDPASAYESMPLAPRVSPDDELIDGGERWAESYTLDFVTDQRQGQRVLEILRRKARAQGRSQLPLRARCAALEAGDWISWTSAQYGYTNQLFKIGDARLGPDNSNAVSLEETSTGIFAWNAASDELDPLNPAELPSGGATFSAVADLEAANITIEGGNGAERPGVLLTWLPVDDPTVVSLRLEYRRQGDAGAMTASVLDAGAGSHILIEGIQGGAVYEVRALPVTEPARAVAWTGWVSTGEAASGQIVETAIITELAEAVPPDTITPEMLSAQTRFELSLASAKAEIQGSVAAHLAEAFEWAQRTGEAALASLANGHENGAQLLTERVERVNGQNALAQQITTAMTWIDENALVVSEVIESVDGIKGKWGVAINSNGVATGFATLSGEGPTSDFTVAANSFTFAHPDIAGGAPQPVFIISEDPENPGQHRAYLNGELIAEAIRAGAVSVGELSAISANAGELVSALMRDPNNIVRWEVNDEVQKIGRTDGTMTFDFGNKIVRIEF